MQQTNNHGWALRAASIGGGGGLVQVARGLLDLGVTVTALVGVTDNGRSTGLARRLFNIPAPGDLRGVLSAFAHEPILREWFESRIQSDAVPALSGMAFGNLVIGSLASVTRSFEAAVIHAAAILGTEIPVYPLSAANVQLCAELEDGSHVSGEVAVRGPDKAPIKRIYLDGPALATESARRSILEADLVTIGPGSLFTSILAGLAIGGVPETLKQSHGKVVYIANTTTQPGQSDSLPLADQILRVAKAANGALDAVLVNNHLPPEDVLARHRERGRQPLLLSDSERTRLEQTGLQVISANLAETESEARDMWQKEDAIRHDPIRLGRVLIDLVRSID